MWQRLVHLFLGLFIQATPVPAPAEVPVVPPVPSFGEATDRWLPWIVIYFQPQDVERALRIIKCESGGNPNARNQSSGAAGLFQHMPQYWADRSSRVGWGGWDIYSPDANIAVAAAMVYYDKRSWSHWTCD